MGDERERGETRLHTHTHTQPPYLKGEGLREGRVRREREGGKGLWGS